MIRLIYVLLLVIPFALAGCDPADREFRQFGPGIDLPSSSAASRTGGLQSYFNELCIRAGLATKSGESQIAACKSDLSSEDWRELVYTGFNDIDARCDAYLNWLYRKRSERLFVDESAIAAGALIGGVLGVAAPGTSALNYVALALRFGQAVYGAYHENLIRFEPSTVRKLVYELRAQRRKDYRSASFDFQPDAENVLRIYLRDCLPEGLEANINAYAVAAIEGRNPLVDDTQRDRGGFAGPLNPDDTVVIVSRPKPETTDEAKKLFVPDEIGYGDTQVRAAQRAMCLQKYENGSYVLENGQFVSGVDGKVGAQTLAGVFVAENYLANIASAAPSVEVDGKLNEAEYKRINSGTVACKGFSLRNYYERVQFTDLAGEAEFVVDLYTYHNNTVAAADKKDPPAAAMQRLANPDVREMIKTVRGLFGTDLKVDGQASDAIKPFIEDAVTHDFYETLQAKL